MEETSKVLDQFNVPHEVLVTSAHRSPERTRKYVQGAKRRGIRVMVAGAGGAAHLYFTMMPISNRDETRKCKLSILITTKKEIWL